MQLERDTQEINLFLELVFQLEVDSSDGSGGPSVSASVSFGITPISIGISLGNSSSSGKFVTGPNAQIVFKLRVQKN